MTNLTRCNFKKSGLTNYTSSKSIITTHHRPSVRHLEYNSKLLVISHLYCRLKRLFSGPRVFSSFEVGSCERTKSNLLFTRHSLNRLFCRLFIYSKVALRCHIPAYLSQTYPEIALQGGYRQSSTRSMENPEKIIRTKCKLIRSRRVAWISDESEKDVWN